MKKLYFLLFGFSILMQAHAQFTIIPKVGYTQGPNTALRTASSTFTNNAMVSSDSLFEWKLLEITTPSAWSLAFCDPKDCYASISSGTTYPFTVNQNANAIFKCDYEFLGVSGNGTIRVVIKSVMNPSNSDTLTFVANSWTTGISEAGRTKEVVSYPNPVKDQLTIKFPSREHIQIEIYNILGTKVKSFVHDASISTINTADLQNGVYFIRFKEGNTVYSKSFTKSY